MIVDIAQVLDDLDTEVSDGGDGDAERFYVCTWLTKPQTARLRELRDAITQYRQAWAARLNSESSTAYMERMHAAGDALLALCREAGA